MEDKIREIKNTPAFRSIESSPFYALIRMFSKAYAPKIDNLAKEGLDVFFRELQAYISKYYNINLMQIVGIAFLVSMFVPLGLALLGVISWVQFMLLILLLVAASFAIYGLCFIFSSYQIGSELNKIKFNIENFAESKVSSLKNIIEHI